MQEFLTNPDNIQIMIGAVFALFSLLSAVFQLLGKVSLSKVFGTITPADIGRIIRKLPQIVAFVVQVIGFFGKKKTPEQVLVSKLTAAAGGKENIVSLGIASANGTVVDEAGNVTSFRAGVDKAAKSTVSLLSLVLLLISASTLTSGCLATLEESSATARIQSVGPVPVTLLSSGIRCQNLSDRETRWGAIAKGGAIATGAAGLATWPVTSHDAEVGLAIGATALAVGTGVAAYVEQQTSMTYVAEGCGK